MKYQVKQWMRQQVMGGAVSVSCGELNITQLGEQAILEFGLDDSPEADVWEWAYEIGQEYEGSDDDR